LSRNKRGVAGSLIWINFDRHSLLNVFRKAQGTFLANKDDIRPQFKINDLEFQDQTAIFNSSLTRSTGVSISSSIEALDNNTLTEVSGFKEKALAWYSDQVLPFDITLSGTNELGAATCMKIFGVEILNEGSGVSIDDAVTEMQATFQVRPGLFLLLAANFLAPRVT
jgi:hypothetical protein